MLVGPENLEAGLYLVATPIGNLGDITLRAIDVLKKADLVAAEDTRRIRKLLNHLEIKVKTISYREQNDQRSTPIIVKTIQENGSVALVSDAGMPCISDPGVSILNTCDDLGLPVHIVPGVSAVTTAVARAGLEEGSFSFLGFPPNKQGQRQKFYAKFMGYQTALVLYESPYRIVESLQDAITILGDRNAMIARELTKVHEETNRAKLSELVNDYRSRKSVKGEFTVVIFPNTEDSRIDLTENQIIDRYNKLIDSGIKPNDALKEIASITGRKKRELYTMLRG